MTNRNTISSDYEMLASGETWRTALRWNLNFVCYFAKARERRRRCSWPFLCCQCGFGSAKASPGLRASLELDLDLDFSRNLVVCREFFLICKSVGLRDACCCAVDTLPF